MPHASHVSLLLFLSLYVHVFFGLIEYFIEICEQCEIFVNIESIHTLCACIFRPKNYTRTNMNIANSVHVDISSN